jgi:hypothetical protein
MIHSLLFHTKSFLKSLFDFIQHSIKNLQRYPTEMRWTNIGYRNRFRYRLGIVYPFGKN